MIINHSATVYPTCPLRAKLGWQWDSAGWIEAWGCHKTLVYHTQPNSPLGTCRSGCHHDGDGYKMSSHITGTTTGAADQEWGQQPQQECLLWCIPHCDVLPPQQESTVCVLECIFVYWLPAVIILGAPSYLVTISSHKSRSLKFWEWFDKQSTERTLSKKISSETGSQTWHRMGWQTQAAVIGTVNYTANKIEWILESAMQTAQWLSFTSPLSFSRKINTFQENTYFQQSIVGITSGILHKPELTTVSWDYLELLTKN